MKKIKRRPFVLLEVLVAMFLVTLCLLPLLAPNIALVKAQQEFANKLKESQEANTKFAYLVQQLYNKRISFAQLTSEYADGALEFTGSIKKDKPPHYIVEVSLLHKGSTYPYELYVSHREKKE